MKICRVEQKREVVDVDYEVCGNEYCCEKMRQWLRIGTRGRNHLRYSIDTGRYEIEVREDGGTYMCQNTCDRAAYEDLNFCPFCGERLQSTEPFARIAYTKKKPKKEWYDAYKGIMSRGKREVVKAAKELNPK